MMQLLQLHMPNFSKPNTEALLVLEIPSSREFSGHIAYHIPIENQDIVLCIFGSTDN